MIGWKPIVLGGLTALLVLMALFALSTLFYAEESKVFRTTEITVAGKICGDEVFGEKISKIQGDDGIIYFIPNADCELYPIGRSGMIFYQHVCNSGFERFCFNRTVGDYK